MKAQLQRAILSLALLGALAIQAATNVPFSSLSVVTPSTSDGLEIFQWTGSNFLATRASVGALIGAKAGTNTPTLYTPALVGNIVHSGGNYTLSSGRLRLVNAANTCELVPQSDTSFLAVGGAASAFAFGTNNGVDNFSYLPLTVLGSVTATSFSGDGSGLTGVTGSQSPVTVEVNAAQHSFTNFANLEFDNRATKQGFHSNNFFGVFSSSAIQSNVVGVFALANAGAIRNAFYGSILTGSSSATVNGNGPNVAGDSVRYFVLGGFHCHIAGDSSASSILSGTDNNMNGTTGGSAILCGGDNEMSSAAYSAMMSDASTISAGNRVYIIGNGHAADSCEQLILAGSSSALSVCTNVLALGQNLTLTNVANSVVIGKDLAGAAPNSVTIGVGTQAISFSATSISIPASANINVGGGATFSGNAPEFSVGATFAGNTASVSDTGDIAAQNFFGSGNGITNLAAENLQAGGTANIDITGSAAGVAEGGLSGYSGTANATTFSASGQGGVTQNVDVQTNAVGPHGITFVITGGIITDVVNY